MGFFLVPVYMRHLQVGEYGVLSLLTITLTVVTIVLKFGLNHAFFRHYYEVKSDSERRSVVGTTVWFLATTSLTFTALLVLAAPRMSTAMLGLAAERSGLLRLIFLIGFFEIITLVPDSILRARFQSGLYSALNIIAFTVQLGLISYLVIKVDASVENVLIGRLGGSIIESAIFFFVVRRELSLKFSLSELRRLLAFGSPLIIGQLAFTLFMMIDRFFIEHYGRDKDVGIYSMANTIVSAVSVLVTVPFSQVWTVMRFSVMDEEGAEEYYSRILTYIVLTSMFLALGVSAVAGDGIILYGLKGYWAAAAIIPLLSLSAVLDGAARVLNVGTTLQKRTIYAPLAVCGALVVNIGLNFFFIPRYGIMGATVSTLLSYVVFCALRFWSSNLFFKVRYQWGRVFTATLIGSLITALFYLVDFLRDHYYQSENYYLSILIKAALALSFPFVLLALGFFDDGELRRISEILRMLMNSLLRKQAPSVPASRFEVVTRTPGDAEQ